MSGFFDGLTNGNIRMPDVQYNVGPLPSTAGGPAGADGTADGLYNFNDSLLSGITPYAYGKPGRMGSDRNYQQIPHRMQQIIPLLHLPHANEKVSELVPVSHCVDQGDVAFVVGTGRVQGILFDRSKQMDTLIANSELPSRNAFVNLATANYLLAGLQRLEKKEYNLITRHPSAWQRLADDLNFNPSNGDRRQEMLKLFRTGFVPYGICAGSEDQGGQHETGLAPVQGAVNYVTTMTVDGQNRDLVNFWRAHSLDSGDEIIYRLDYLPTQHFTLNHYYKGVVHQSFSKPVMCWQICPDVYRICGNPDRPTYPWPYDYRLLGYWRVARMFHHRLKNDLPTANYADDTVFLQGALLHVNFAPVFVQHEFPHKLITAAVKEAMGKAGGATSSMEIELSKKRKFGFDVTTDYYAHSSLPNLSTQPTYSYREMAENSVMKYPPLTIPTIARPIQPTLPTGAQEGEGMVADLFEKAVAAVNEVEAQDEGAQTQKAVGDKKKQKTITVKKKETKKTTVQVNGNPE